MSCCVADAPAHCHPGSLFDHTELKLDTASKQEIRRVHPFVQAYLEARTEGKGEDKAKKDLLDLAVQPAFAPVQLTNQVLLSLTRLYWFATISSLAPQPLSLLRERLSSLPTFGNMDILAFDGTEVTPEGARTLNKARTETVMRCTMLVGQGLLDASVGEMWRELADAGGQLWVVEE